MNRIDRNLANATREMDVCDDIRFITQTLKNPIRALVSDIQFATAVDVA